MEPIYLFAQFRYIRLQHSVTAFFNSSHSGTIFDGLLRKKARILRPLRVMRICWCASLMMDLILPSMVSELDKGLSLIHI